MATFEHYEDRSGEYRWRLKADNGKIVADSAEGYDHQSDAERGAQDFQEQGPDAPVHNLEEEGAGGSSPEWELYEDSAGEWRWRFQARNNRTIADSGEGYSSESNGERAIEDVKKILRDL